MALVLYSHPFASYCQKALIALYENKTSFSMRLISDGKAFAELEALWPLKKFPLLVDGSTVVVEASIIIEYLEHHYPGTVPLLPKKADAALQTRFMDRFFDNYIMTPVTRVVGDSRRPATGRDPIGVAEARAQLDTSYQWLDSQLISHEWAIGDEFSLADCAAAPSLFYADWVHEIGKQWPNVRAYRTRLLARPSVARVVDEARPYRHVFPAGAPDRD